MNKILKITLLCLSLVSCLFISAFSAFAYSQEDFASYGSIKYTELTSGGNEVDDLVLPIIVDEDFPYYSRYTSGANKTWQSLNFVERYARIRSILPAKGMNGFVSSASNVSFTLQVAYPSQQFNNNWYDNYVFAIDYTPFGWTPVQTSINVYTYDSNNDLVIDSSNEVFSGQMEFDFYDLGLNRQDIAPQIWYCFDIKVVFDPIEDASDFTIVLPDTYQYFPFDIEQIDADLAYTEGFGIGYDEGFGIGYDEGYVNGLEENINFFEFVGDAVSTFMSIELFPDFSLGVLLLFILSVSFIGIVAKLLAGG